MRDLRLLGIAHSVEPTAFISLGKLAWIGFTINALSGILLFTSQATIFITSIPFLLKISFITVGMVLAVIIQARLSNLLVDDRYINSVDRTTRFLAAISMSLWIGAIIAGRLIAYF
jgi:glucan phosphoethanolaminetransferase (alkaline phosphatase superfamily)